MTQDELRALGERWKACPGFRWRPGMWIEWERPNGAGGQQWMPSAARVADLPMGPLPITYGLVDPGAVWREAWPVLSCPATRGWLIEDVREAYGDPAAHVEPVGAVASGRAQWAVRIFSGECLYPFIQCQRVTEVEALIAALEAAPR